MFNLTSIFYANTDRHNFKFHNFKMRKNFTSIEKSFIGKGDYVKRYCTTLPIFGLIKHGGKVFCPYFETPLVCITCIMIFSIYFNDNTRYRALPKHTRIKI